MTSYTLYILFHSSHSSLLRLPPFSLQNQAHEMADPLGADVRSSLADLDEKLTKNLVDFQTHLNRVAAENAARPAFPRITTSTSL